VRAWNDRVVEVAYLFNPAFGATLIAEAVHNYNEKTKTALPFAATFLLLPIVLHENTRKSLPKTTLTALLPWVQDHRESLVGFSERVQQLREMTRESILFGLQSEVLQITDNGSIAVGKKRKSVTAKRTPLFTDEANECVERSGFLGRWFATSGAPANIFSAWGIAP
jgi:hypothetical protein